MRRRLSLYFNYLISATAGGPVSSRGHMHVAKFYGRLQLICSDLRASKFSELELIEIVILLVYYTILFCFGLFRHLRVNIFYFWTHFGLRSNTDEGSLPTMRI